MLHLILGTAGTGKTTLLHERIQDCVRAGGKAILLVPEQYSFESEKALYRRLGAKDALSVEVLSFTRLCERIFRELGGLAGVHLDKTAKYLLMSVTLGEIGEELCCYRKSVGSAAFAASMCETVSELKTAGAKPEQLREIAQQSADAALSDKLRDIALIFETYQAVIERGYSDPDDNLARACVLLESGGAFFEQYTVFVDGFMAFMGAEWRLLAQAIAKSQAVHAALTCKGLFDQNPGCAFSAVCKTAGRLTALARENGRQVAVPVVCEKQHRFSNPTLAYLAAEYPNAAHTPCDFQAQGVQIVPCEDIYDELEYIAAQSVRLIREEGLRWRDIAIIGRSLEHYLLPLQTVFARYDIPFFADMRVDIQVHPLAAGLLDALEAVRGRFDTSHILALAKNCICGVDALDAALLDNYCFVWNVSGAAWTQPFVNHPDGMQEEMDEEQTERLARINAVRAQLIGPLGRLKAALSGCDGRGFAQALFDWLEHSGAADNLQQYAAGMEDSKAFLDMSAQVWDVLIGLLDVFGTVLAGLRLPPARLIDLLRLGLSSADLGQLPQTLDQIIVGMADRIRPHEPKAVFVLGLNEGAFPLWNIPGGVFSPAEREALGAGGVGLLRTPEQYALFEQYFVYFSLTQASDYLWLTYPCRDTNGGGIAPSPVVEQVKTLLGAEATAPLQESVFERVSGERSAFDRMTRTWYDVSPEQAVLRDYFENHAPQRVWALKQAAGERMFMLQDKQAATALLGSRVRLSPSGAEQYYACPFSYFCKSGLCIAPRRRVEFSPLESGSLVHLVLEHMVKKYGGRGLSKLDEPTMRAEVGDLIRWELQAKIQDFENMPRRFHYLFRRLEGTLVRLLRRLAVEFAQSLFEPVAFELPIREDAKIKPLRLHTVDGVQVIVEGVADRVDILEKDGVRYARVVDYKSGRKEFNLADVYYGLNMQMLIYLFSICEHGWEQEGDTMPAGILYMPARDSIISAERSTPEKEIQQAHLKRLRMSGLLLEDREVLCAMEPDLEGVFIPVKTKKDGSFSATSSLAHLAGMGAIRRRVEKLLVGIADSLRDGQIQAAPAQGLAGYDPCAWCDYSTVCGHEDSDAVRRLADMDRLEALARMEEERNG